MIGAALTVAAAVVVVGALRSAFCVVVVVGDSMRPLLRPGDRLLVCRWWRRGWYGMGDVVTLRPPPDSGLPGDIHVKRIVGCPEEKTVTVMGDNRAASVDSRSYGPVRRSELRGRALHVLRRRRPYHGSSDGDQAASRGRVGGLAGPPPPRPG